MAKKTTKTTKITGRKKTTRKAKADHRPTAVEIKNLAMTAEDVPAAEAAAGMTTSLQAMLNRYKSLRQAWDRGQFLRKLREFGAAAVELEEAGHELGMEPGGLSAILETDDEAREVFNNARIKTIVAVHMAQVEPFLEGKGTPTGAKRLMALMKREVARKGVNFEQVTTEQMEELFGVTRQTLHDWKKNRGMPSNLDGSFNVKACLQQSWREKPDGGRERVPSWFEGMLLEKIAHQPGKFLERPADEVRSLDAEKKRLQIGELKKSLVPAAEALVLKLWTAFKVTSWIDANEEKMALDLAGLEPSRMREELTSYIQGLRNAALERPDNYWELLPEEVAVRFEAILRLLAGEEG